MRLGFVIVCAALPLAAHHSTRAEFDDSKLVTMQGVVTHVQWMNPHARFFIDVTGADGKVVNWEIELPSPNGLMLQGWKRDTFKVGDRVVVDVWLAKMGQNLASTRSLTLPDGRVLSGATAWDGPFKDGPFKDGPFKKQ